MPGEFSLANRVALVTGARRGIGRGIALALAGAGADVAVCSRNVASGELDAVAEGIRGLGRRAMAHQADVTVRAEVEELVRRVEGELGPINILVNNAGGGADEGERHSISQTTDEEWQVIIDKNLKSSHLCSQVAGHGMMACGGGSIINISSCAGIRGFSGRSTYNVAKAGVIMLTKVLARDLGRYNIRANAIAPAMIHTEATQPFWDDEKTMNAERARIPLGRLGEVSDITGVAVFLASEAAAYISGHTIVVDGGQLA